MSEPRNHRDYARWLLIGALLFIVWYGQHSGTTDKATEGASAKKAICALRADIIRRHDNTEDYLVQHPLGVTAKGVVVISGAQLRKGLRDQEQTIDAIDKSGVNC